MENLVLNKIITCEIKEVSPRVLEFIGSTEDKDRQGDVVRASGWNLKNYKKNPLFMWAHDYASPPIGKAVKVWVKDDKLMFHIEFADKDTYEFADTIYRLYKGGFLKATSVGFTPLNWEGKSEEDDIPAWGGNVFTEQELLELSGCPVPANPEALATAKQKRIISAKEFKAFNELNEKMLDAEKAKAEEVIKQINEEKAKSEPVTKPEETNDYIRIPVKAEEGKHDGHRIRTITISESEGIKALYCGEDKVVITYLFDKDKDWTMESAQAWVDEHSKDQKALSQIEISDELDYCLSLIMVGNLNDNNRELAIELSNEIRRLTGCDKPEDIEPEPTLVITEEDTKHNTTTEPPPAEALTEQDKERVAQIITKVVDRVIENRSK
jgi:HK97 family phage prohead protease